MFSDKFSDFCNHYINAELEPFAIKFLKFLVLEKNIESISKTEKITEKIFDNFFDVHEIFENILAYKKLQDIPTNQNKNNLRKKI